MKNFRYIFDTSSKKFHCPECRKKRFVRYVDKKTNEYLADRFGRCDRIDNCQYWLKPEEDFSDYELPEPVPEKPLDYLSLDLIEATGKGFKKNNFIQFLRSIVSDEKVQEVIERFLIGTSNHWKGATIFWLLDERGKVRAGNIMLYDKATGKRVKINGNPQITSVRAVMKRYDLNLKQCLFGLHQLQEENKPIAIVESEKTAIISFMFNDSFTWLATGSENTFNDFHLSPVKDKIIIAFPDKGCFDNWSERAERLNAIGYNITVDRGLEEADVEKGSDIADLILTKTPLERFINKNPSVDLLIETFDLDRGNYTISAV